MKNLMRGCAAALCGIMLVVSACGNTSTSNKAADSKDDVLKQGPVIDVAETKTVAPGKTFQKLDNEAQIDITDEALNKVDSFDDVVSKIKINDSDSQDKRLDYVYSEIQNISTQNDYAIASVEKGDNGVIVLFKSGIIYYYPVEHEGTRDGKGVLHVSTEQPYNASGVNSLKNERTDQAALDIENAVENTKFGLNIDNEEVSFEMLDDIFAPNSIVIWDGHGGYEETIGFFLPLGENSWDAVKENEFLRRAAAINHIVLCTDSRMAITANFLIDIDITVTNSAIFLDTCYSMVNGDFAGALVRKGASLVYGYTDSVLVSYADPMLYCILEEMSKKEGDEYTHFEAASKIARSKYGPCSIFKDRKGVIHEAYPCICGDGEYHFDAAIKKISNVGEEDPKTSAEENPGTSSGEKPSTSAEGAPSSSSEAPPNTSSGEIPNTPAGGNPGTSVFIVK